MDRRKFLTAASILGGGKVFASTVETLPLACPDFTEPALTRHQAKRAEAVSQDTERVSKVGIVAIGSAGIWILDYLNGKLPRLYRSVAVDTSPLLLHRSNANTRILIDSRTCLNVGTTAAGAQAKTVVDKIVCAIEGIDQVFILTGMESRLEKELALVVAKITQDAQTMVIGAVATSFDPGRTGARLNAQEGIDWLIQQDIPTVSLSRRRYGGTGIYGVVETQREEAVAFEQLYRSTVIIQEGDGQSLIWQDPEGVQTVFSKNSHFPLAIGYGAAQGSDSGQLAARRAMSHSLFDAGRVSSASALLISIEARPESLKMRELNRILNIVRERFPDSHFIFGAYLNPRLKDDFRVTVVAPGASLI